jgi:hypothetical protein
LFEGVSLPSIEKCVFEAVEGTGWLLLASMYVASLYARAEIKKQEKNALIAIAKGIGKVE